MCNTMPKSELEIRDDAPMLQPGWKVFFRGDNGSLRPVFNRYTPYQANPKMGGGYITWNEGRSEDHNFVRGFNFFLEKGHAEEYRQRVAQIIFFPREYSLVCRRITATGVHGYFKGNEGTYTGQRNYMTIGIAAGFRIEMDREKKNDEV